MMINLAKDIEDQLTSEERLQVFPPIPPSRPATPPLQSGERRLFKPSRLEYGLPEP